MVFLVDVDACLPSDAQWPELWRKQEAWRRERTAQEEAEQKRKDQVRSGCQTLLVLVAVVELKAWGISGIDAQRIGQWLSNLLKRKRLTQSISQCQDLDPIPCHLSAQISHSLRWLRSSQQKGMGCSAALMLSVFVKILLGWGPQLTMSLWPHQDV